MYEVSIWDLAGQDEYHSSHSLFYSKRTMYVVCVNLKVYVDMLKQEELMDRPGVVHPPMDAFVDLNIYRWIRNICARHPESEFVFVGTKSDLVGHDGMTAEIIMADLMARLKRKEARELKAIDQARRKMREKCLVTTTSKDEVTTVLRRQLAELDARYSRRPKYMSETLAFASSANLNGLDGVRNVIEEAIRSCGSCFLMPDTFLALNTHLKEIVRGAEANIANGACIRETIVQSTELQSALLIDSSLQINDPTEITTALHVLHDLGDILWLDSGAGILSKTIFLSPKFAIDFIRQVVNHTLVDEAYVASVKDRWGELYCKVREEGCVQHELLMRLELWRDVDDANHMLELKLLMYELQLAYPAGLEGMMADSDLIVPLYWKKNSKYPMLSLNSKPVGNVSTNWPHHVVWEYEFQEHLPEDFFEKLGVRSYSLYHSTDREFSRDEFKSTVADKYETTIRKRHVAAEDEWECDIVTLSIVISAATAEVSWQQLKWYSMSVEKLLESYPGLWVKRYAVSTSGRRFALDQLVIEMQRTKTCPLGGLLPPSMDCLKILSTVNYIAGTVTCVRVEQRAGFQGIERSLDETKRAIIRVQTAAGNRMLYPALWTLEYQPQPNRVTSTFTLTFRSELSGLCYHEDEQIVIIFGNAFFGKYGGYIKIGLSIFSSMVPDKFGKHLLEKAIKVCIDQLDRTVKVHSLVEGLNLSASGASREMSQDRSMSPGETLALLRDLLQAKYRSDFDVLKMTKYSGLECGVVMEAMTTPYAISCGNCIWASREEIEQCGSKMIVAHDYVKPRVAETQVESGIAVAGKREEGDLEQGDTNHCEVAANRTLPHKKGGASPQWETQPFWIDLQGSSASSFDGCAFFYHQNTRLASWDQHNHRRGIVQISRCGEEIGHRGWQVGACEYDPHVQRVSGWGAPLQDPVGNERAVVVVFESEKPVGRWVTMVCDDSNGATAHVEHYAYANGGASLADDAAFDAFFFDLEGFPTLPVTAVDVKPSSIEEDEETDPTETLLKDMLALDDVVSNQEDVCEDEESDVSSPSVKKVVAGAVKTEKPAMNQKEETEYLRKHVQELEEELERLQQRTGRVIETRKVSVWKGIAERQREAKQRAEINNTKLREALEEQLKTVQSLKKLLRKRQHAMLSELDQPCVVSMPCESDRVFDALHSMMTASSMEMDAILIESGLHIDDTDYHNQQVRHRSNGRPCLEIVSSREFPFPLEATTDSVWNLVNSVNFEVHNAVTGSVRAFDTHCHLHFTANRLVRRSKVEAEVFAVSRREDQQDRVVLKWESRVFLTVSTLRCERVCLRERRFVVVERAVSDASSSVVKSCMHCWADDDSISTDRRFELVVDLLLGAYQENLQMLYQMTENQLLGSL
ncbi:hypothetical protein Poli38472_004828 [Pythium oligandrum]|uniref:Uncharacterized protein n=1 Tax=Pythium oligandrum TaxID=41045 RepID=A0A8K1FG90_PYTOL|nr:hypothetical protein Poli38472_004828 [Pythium oligandrum]|eukprot:TMW59759.1 hypothetical protein Poli38472_004828 [Pythium oligandrum]